MSATCSVRRWLSPRWPLWPLELKVSLCRGKLVLVGSIEIVVSGGFAPTAIKLEASSGASLGRVEYSPSSSNSQRTLLGCSPAIETTHLKLIIQKPYHSPKNLCNQVLIKRLTIHYSLPGYNPNKNDQQPNERVQDDDVEEFIIPVKSSPPAVDQHPITSYHILRGICTKSIARLRQRLFECEQLQFKEECVRLDQSIVILSQLMDNASELEHNRLAAIRLDKECERNQVTGMLLEVCHQVEEEIAKMNSFDPVSLLHSDPIPQPECEQKLNSLIQEPEIKADPYADLEFSDDKLLTLELDRSRMARPLYEVFGHNAIQALLSSSSVSDRLQAAHHCLSKIRSNLHDHLYKSAAERLLSITCYDTSFKIRQISFAIAEVVLEPGSLISNACHFLCDSCKDIRNDAIWVLTRMWSESEDRQIVINQQLVRDIPDDDWRQYLGHCFAIHRLITRFGCCELSKGSRVSLSVIMPFITRALQNQHQSVRTAAAAICNEIEQILGHSAIEPYLNRIDPLSMLPNIDEPTDLPKSNCTDNVKESRKDSDLPISATSTQVMHLLPTANNVEELLQIWSF